MTKALDELSVLVEFHDARIAECRCMAFGDKDVAIRCKDDSCRPVEDIRILAALPGLAQSHQHLSVWREFENLIALAFFHVAVDGPDVALRVWFYRMREDEHAGAQ